MSLVELLVVIALIGVMTTLLVPSLSRMAGSGPAKAYYDIAGVIENARTHAIANNTYVFVGFAETDVNTPATEPQKPGIGRVYAAAVASKDGTRNFDWASSQVASEWSSNYKNGDGLTPVVKLAYWDNVHMTAILPRATTGPFAERPFNNYKQIGDTISNTPFTWPLGKSLGPTSAAGSMYFDRVVMFDPDGIARMQASTGNRIEQYVELCLQLSRGAEDPGMPTDSSAGNHAAISINGLTGAVRIFRP